VIDKICRVLNFLWRVILKKYHKLWKQFNSSNWQDIRSYIAISDYRLE